MTGRQLIKAAKEAQAFSYSPYSGFKVGAALLCKSGKVYTGCNIENASFSATVCAERTALFKAVSEGEREFSAMAIVGSTDLCFPCGVCRQVMSEFCCADFKIYLEENGKPVTYALGELLPGRFDFKK